MMSISRSRREVSDNTSGGQCSSSISPSCKRSTCGVRVCVNVCVRESISLFSLRTVLEQHLALVQEQPPHLVHSLTENEREL